MTQDDFMFKDRFTGLPESAITEAIMFIETSWSGIRTLWTTVPLAMRTQKQTLCINYLVAWYLADLYPLSVQGVFSLNGAPLKSKAIGGTQVSFYSRKVQAELEPLTTNIYGMKALEMIRSCPDMYLLR